MSKQSTRDARHQTLHDRIDECITLCFALSDTLQQEDIQKHHADHPKWDEDRLCKDARDWKQANRTAKLGDAINHFRKAFLILGDVFPNCQEFDSMDELLGNLTNGYGTKGTP